MSEVEFVQTFGSVYESSAWAAEAAFEKVPFKSPEALAHTFQQAVDGASPEMQEQLILAHPDLAGKLARSGQLTADSTREQSRLGLDQLDEAEYAEFDLMNRAYRERFHFPFIICVGLLQHRSQVLSAFHARLSNSRAAELREALHQIHLIAALRLSALVEDLPPPTPARSPS